MTKTVDTFCGEGDPGREVKPNDYKYRCVHFVVKQIKEATPSD